MWNSLLNRYPFLFNQTSLLFLFRCMIALFFALPLFWAITHYGMLYKEKESRSQEKQEEQTIHTIEQIIQEAQSGQTKKALAAMIEVGAYLYTPRQILAWRMGMGRIYLERLKQGDGNTEINAQLAQRFLQEALELCQTPQDRNEVDVVLGEFYLHLGQYLLASRHLNRLDRSLLKKDLLEQVDLRRAICDWHLGNPQRALDLAYMVANTTDNHHIWASALVHAGEWMLEVVENKSLQEVLSRTKLTPVDPLHIKEEAEKIFRVLINHTNSFSEYHNTSKLGLIKILLLDGKLNEAYDIANTILTELVEDRLKIQCLNLLVDAEERLQNTNKVLEILRYGHQQFYNYRGVNPLTTKYYRLLKKLELYDEAFLVIEDVVKKGEDIQLIQEILKDFFPVEGVFFEKIDWNDQQRKYYDRTLRILDMLNHEKYTSYPQIAESIGFLRCAIPIAAHKDEEAETQIGFFQRQTDDPSFRQWLLYLDCLGAHRMQRPPVIRAIRALRYIHEFPQGIYFGYVIGGLLQAYYEMGLYNQAMNTAKLMFVKEVVRLGESIQEKPDIPRSLVEKGVETYGNWLNTILKIAQCHIREGNYLRAELIYRNYMDYFLTQPLPDDVYIDWYQLAILRGQSMEAIRRIDLILPLLKQKLSRYQAELARSLRKLELNTPNALLEHHALLTKIEKEEVFDEIQELTKLANLSGKMNQQKREEQLVRMRLLQKEVELGQRLTKKQQEDLLRQAYIYRLNYAFKHMKAESSLPIKEWLMETKERFPSESWVEYWFLHWLNQEIEDKKNKEVLSTMKQFLEYFQPTYHLHQFLLNQIYFLERIEKYQQIKQNLETRGILQ